MPEYSIVRSGQPRAYADSEYVVNVYLEKGLTREQASDTIRSMNIGFDDSSDRDWFQPRLAYLMEFEPGTWQFKMVEGYTG